MYHENTNGEKVRGNFNSICKVDFKEKALPELKRIHTLEDTYVVNVKAKTERPSSRNRQTHNPNGRFKPFSLGYRISRKIKWKRRER